MNRLTPFCAHIFFLVSTPPVSSSPVATSLWTGCRGGSRRRRGRRHRGAPGPPQRRRRPRGFGQLTQGATAAGRTATSGRDGEEGVTETEGEGRRTFGKGWGKMMMILILLLNCTVFVDEKRTCVEGILIQSCLIFLHCDASDCICFIFPFILRSSLK